MGEGVTEDGKTTTKHCPHQPNHEYLKSRTGLSAQGRGQQEGGWLDGEVTAGRKKGRKEGRKSA